MTTVDTPPRAWHGDPALKAEVLGRLRAHRADDEIVQGTYQRLSPDTASGYRGCAIGCTLPRQALDHDIHGEITGILEPDADGWHGEVERLYGIPEWIGMRIDWAFEDLPAEDCAEFAVAVIDAIPVGADLDAMALKLPYPDAVDASEDGYVAIRAYAAGFIAELAAAPVPAVKA